MFRWSLIVDGGEFLVGIRGSRDTWGNIIVESATGMKGETMDKLVKAILEALTTADKIVGHDGEKPKEV